MHITQRRVRSVKRVLGPLLPHTKFRIITQVNDLPADALTKAGFSQAPAPGDTILPSPVGSVTEHNANGRYNVRKDLPKEERYITTIEWTWEQWAGYGQTETMIENRDIFKECYQRDFFPPPAAELSIVDYNGELLVVSEELVNENAQLEHIKHLLNMYLELFGECEIRHANLRSITPTITRKVNWQLLRPGKYPWSKVHSHVKIILEDKDTRFSNPVLSRQELIAAFNPDEVYVGQGGFRSYVAYIFKVKGLAVLESVMLDNATYVFDRNWQQLSQLTKAEILQGNLQRDRVIHSEGWKDRIDALLS